MSACPAYWNGVRCERDSIHPDPHVANRNGETFEWGGKDSPAELWGKTATDLRKATT